jgi:methionine-rich copper-binding protein CopC
MSLAQFLQYGLPVLGLVVLGFVPTARAHVDILASTPSAGQSLTTPPRALVVEFSGPVQAPTLFLLYGAQQYPLQPSVDGENPQRISASLAGLTFEAGLYQVVWSVEDKADGHRLSGSFSFEIQPAPSLPWLWLALGAALVVSLLISAGWLWCRTRRQEG